MIRKIFKRWDIGIGNERVSYLHCALRMYLPQDGYIGVNKFDGQMLLRLAQVNYNPDIRLAVERMQNEIYGGPHYRIDTKRLREALR